MTMVNSGLKGLNISTIAMLIASIAALAFNLSFNKNIRREISIEMLLLKVICFDSSCTEVSHFYPLEVVGRGSETQLQVGEN